jgi:serine/threonine protein kinase/formylglycine-generating enzyme required for sulfatase activity
MIGSVVKDRYQVLQKTGSGTIYDVYLAMDSAVGEVVLLKVLHPDLIRETPFLDRLQREARRLQKLDSPHAARLVDYGQEGQALFVVFEYVPGRTLDRILAEEGTIDEDRALAIARQVAQGLADANAVGIVHSNLCPGNIVVTSGEAVRVTDWGIAAGADLPRLLSGGALGVPHYLAPELARGGEGEIQTDVYALGAVLFEMVTGRVPYEGEDAASVADLHVNGPIPSVRDLNPGTSQQVDELIARCLAKEPRDRYLPLQLIELIADLLQEAPVAPGAEETLTGHTLGHYQLLERLGRGGMATVYKAYQPGLDRYVAVKILPTYMARDSDFSARFRREARAIARLNHPNILPVYDFGQDKGLNYIVMRYVEAGTLKELLGQPLDLRTTLDIISQVGGALDYAHQEGVIHRDVKPSNVLMDRGEWALLGDFGLARMMEASVRLTGTGVGVGTPTYMSPEQGQGTTVDARSDVYSLGIMLFEMLTGRVPYQAETPMAVVIKHLTAPLPLPRDANPSIPEAAERVIFKALAKDPADRYQTAGELVEALRWVVEEAEMPLAALAPLAPIDELPAEEVSPTPVEEPAAEMPPPEAAAEREAERTTSLVEPSAEPVAVPFWRRVPWWAWVLIVILLGGGAATVAVFWPRPAAMPADTPVAVVASTPMPTSTETTQPTPTEITEPTPTATAQATPTATAPSDVAPVESDMLPMRIRVSTTSDWTSVTFVSAVLRSDLFDVIVLSEDDVVESETVELEGTTTRAEMKGRTIHLQQRLDSAEGGETVSIVQDVTLEGVTKDRVLQFIVEKGCLGTTAVEFSSLATGAPILVERFEMDECPELGVSFGIDVDALLADTLTRSMEIVTRSWEQDGSTLVYVAEGPFWMGATEDDPGGDDARPQHEVYLDAFWIDRTEVTNAQYGRCVSAGACDPPALLGSLTREDYYDNAEYGDYPVLHVTWRQAAGYCRWAGKRLPTEAEWEKAARGTDKRLYPWGDEFDGTRLSFCDANCGADYRDADWDDGYDDTAPVGSYPAGASPYGALDMAGNVREWVADWADTGYYARSPQRNPTGPESGESRVDRGGAASDGKGAALVTYRGYDDPSVAYGDIGFRCALSAAELALRTLPREGKHLYVCPDTDPPQICVQDQAGPMVQITEDLQFERNDPSTWSPSGRQIAFSAGSGDVANALYVMDADGSGMTRIAGGEPSYWGPVWSPDGEWLAAIRGGDVWAVRPDGSGERMLLPAAAETGLAAVAWSPDGQALAAMAWRDGLASEVWVVNRDGGDPHKVYTFEPPVRSGGWVFWSPDGQQVMPWLADEEWGLLIDADGSGRAQEIGWMPWWWSPGFWPPWGRTDYSVVREVWVDLGAENEEYGLVQIEQGGDGITEPAEIGGRAARVMMPNGTGGRFIYFGVDDGFLFAQQARIRITVEYYDQGDFHFDVSYDSMEDCYKATDPILLENSGQWKIATFDLPDARFEGCQHNQFDFRIGAPERDLYINKVVVTKQ